MAATTRLIVFNDVLREIASQPLLNLTTPNTRLQELDGAFDHAVEYQLSKLDWAFARRRATLTGVSDTSFPPYTYRYTKPSDYLRKCWIKLDAADEQQISHAEVGAVFYGFEPTALIEYVSDHADNYDPANWPPHFTRCMVLYLAQLVAPKLARAGSGDVGMLEGKMQAALAEAEGFEAVFFINAQIPANRLPVMRRALEFMGQVLAGSVPVMSQADKLRWHMNQSWDHCLKYLLELGAWNFATRRVILTGGTEPVPGDTVSDIIEGYSLPPAEAPAPSNLPDMAGYDYGYNLPDDFLHKIWIKADANRDLECDHQFMRDAVYTNAQPVVMEYIAWDDDSTNPGEWSANFLEAMAAYLALTVSPELVIEQGAKNIRIAANDIRQKLEAVWMDKLSDAKLRDAIQQYPENIPVGSFVRARRGSIGTTGMLKRLN